MKPEAAAAPYADPNIFLFLGGFLLAQAFQKWELHRRVALLMLTVMGTRLHQLLLGCILATAVISMWVSNTATAMMMLPIGMAVASQVGVETSDPHNRAVGDNFKAGLMLGIACAASIGGMATLIGTPPNVIFAGQVRQLFPELGEVGFLRWMLVGVPLAGVYLLMLPATLAASCGFMLPVATPPSAVALASGYVAALQMMRVGLVLDVLGAIVVTLAVSTLGRAVFALD